MAACLLLAAAATATIIFTQRDEPPIAEARAGDLVSPLSVELLALSVSQNADYTATATATAVPTPEPIVAANVIAAAPIRDAAPLPPRPAPRAVPVADPALAARVFDALNAWRARQGLPAFVADSRLTSAASSYAMLLATRTTALSHTGPDGSTMQSRILAAGYPANTAIGEVLALGPSSWDAASIISAWNNSPSHRAVILNASYRSAGAGCVVGTDGSVRCVVDFGG